MENLLWIKSICYLAAKVQGVFLKSNLVPFQLLWQTELGKVKAKRRKRKYAYIAVEGPRQNRGRGPWRA